MSDERSIKSNNNRRSEKPNVMANGEPSAGAIVCDRLTRQAGVVAEVKNGGWRLVQYLNGTQKSRRSGNLAYLDQSVIPPPALLVMAQQLGGSTLRHQRASAEENADLFIEPRLEEDARRRHHVYSSPSSYGRMISESATPLPKRSRPMTLPIQHPALRPSQVYDVSPLKKEEDVDALIPLNPSTTSRGISPSGGHDTATTKKKKRTKSQSQEDATKKKKPVNTFPNLEPSLWKIVKCQDSGEIGMVIQVKCSGWRVVRTLDGKELIKRPTQLAYAPEECMCPEFIAMRKQFEAQVAEASLREKERRREARASKAKAAEVLAIKNTFMRPQIPPNTMRQARPVEYAATDADSSDDDYVLRLTFDDGSYAEEPCTQLPVNQHAKMNYLKSLVGKRILYSKGRHAFVSGYAKRADSVSGAALVLVQLNDKKIHATHQGTTISKDEYQQEEAIRSYPSPRTALVAACMGELASPCNHRRQSSQQLTGVTPDPRPLTSYPEITTNTFPSIQQESTRDAPHPSVTPAESTDGRPSDYKYEQSEDSFQLYTAPTTTHK